jgi:protein-S-isoprenylcysteine O-methyltransferase Ste14
MSQKSAAAGMTSGTQDRLQQPLSTTAPEASPPSRRVVDGLFMAASAILGGGSIVLFAGAAPVVWPLVPMSRTWPVSSALAWDAALCVLFFVQHSTMNRRCFHRLVSPWLDARYHGALYGIASGLALGVLAVLWQPTTVDVFVLSGAAAWIIRALGVAALATFIWGFVAVSEDIFGWAPIKAHLRRTPPQTPTLSFRGPYRWVRHPLYLAVLALMWTDPRR